MHQVKREVKNRLLISRNIKSDIPHRHEELFDDAILQTAGNVLDGAPAQLNAISMGFRCIKTWKQIRETYFRETGEHINQSAMSYAYRRSIEHMCEATPNTEETEPLDKFLKWALEQE